MNGAREAELAALSSEVRELLVRRAERIRAPNASPFDADDEVMWVASFRLGDREYSIPLSALRGTIPRRMVTPVPGAPRAVLGILQFNGEIVTAFSMASLLETKGHAPTPILLVVDLGRGHIVAFDCEHVPLATTISLSAFRAAHLPAGGTPPLVSGSRPGVLTVVNLQQLVQSQVRRASHVPR
jgi:purine-binding chemotaxis protein CheW